MDEGKDEETPVVTGENILPKKFVQKSITEFKNVKVHSVDSSNSHGFSDLGANEASTPVRRRSTRVIPKRKVEIEDEPTPPRKKKMPTKKSTAKSKKGQKSMAGKDKKKAPVREKKATIGNGIEKTQSTRKASLGSAEERNKLAVKQFSKEQKDKTDQSKQSSKSPPKQATPSLAINPILLENWAPQVPLPSSDFKSHSSIISRLKLPHMRPVEYAKDLLFVMSFINKFNKFLPKDLWSLSIQDFELGLDLYPGVLEGSDQETLSYYSNYIPIKEVKRCQDSINLLFLCLMRLTLNQKSQPSLKYLQSTAKPYAKFISELKSKAIEFGYPSEWKVKSTLEISNMKLFEEDDIDPVDPNHPEILTPNVYKPLEQLIVPIEEDPLHNAELDRLGLLALTPKDRVIILRTLVQWCIANSEKIHGEIYHLSHPKKEPSFGIQTYQAPRHLVQGIEASRQHFKKLCTLVKERMELRRSKKHVKKHLENGTRQDLSAKYELLDELKNSMKQYKLEHDQNSLDKKRIFDPLNVSIDRDYSKWSKLIYEETNDHEPLQDPYRDEVFKLRSLEFFVGRVPYVGDFYLPRLFTYQNSKKKDTVPTNYCDPITLLKTFNDFETGKITPFELFGKNGKSMSLQFKLYYHDTPSMIHDLSTGESGKKKTYWYEMCHDIESLRDFIKLLEYKVYKEPVSRKKSANKNKDMHQSANVAADVPTTTGAAEDIETKTELSGETEVPPSGLPPTPGFNCNPLPKEYKYNKSRSKLLILKEYLEKMTCLLKTFEDLKKEYGDMDNNDRNLRRSQRTKINYVEQSLDVSDDEHEPDEEDEDPYVDKDDGGDDYEEENSENEAEDIEDFHDEYEVEVENKSTRHRKKTSTA